MAKRSKPNSGHGTGKRRKGRRHGRPALAAVIAALALVIGLAPSVGQNVSGTVSQGSSQTGSISASDASGNLVVKFVDVGQGDAEIVEFPDGKTMVIDTASDGDYAVNPILQADGRTTINWLVATHPDSDHIGGLPWVIGENTVESVWAPEVSNNTAAYTRFLQAVDKAGLQIDAAVAGKRIAEGQGYTIDLLWPEMPPEGEEYADTNDYSAIVLVTYGSTRFLFTGDAPVEAEKLADAGQVDVLKVSHHGSASGTDDELAASLSPQIAVLSYGLDNDYGHPAQVVLDALQDAGAAVYGTGANGTVTVTSDGTNVSAAVEREGEVVAASERAGITSRSLDVQDAE